MKTFGDGWTMVLLGLLALLAQPATTNASCKLLKIEDRLTSQWTDHFLQKVRFANPAILCENIANSSDVPLAERSLRELSSPGQQLAIFFLRCNLDVLPANFLASTEVSHLAFCKCNMRDIPYELINSVRDTLTLFWIINSLVSSRTISGGRFRYNLNMKEIAISDSGIESVEGSPFYGFSNLTKLNIWGNHISSLDRGTFDCLTNLKHLNIHLNNIRSLDEDLFVDLINLEHLDLYGNQMTTLSDGIFDTLIKLNFIDVRDNDWHCNCDLQWLQDWIRDVIPREQGFWGVGSCRTPVEGDLYNLNFCNSSRPAKKTKKKTVSRDCSINESRPNLTDDQTWFNHVASFLFSFFVL